MLYELIENELPSFRKRQFKRNEIVYNEGDSPRNIYLIESGIIGLFHISETGHETLLRVFSKKYIFGHRSLIANENYHASAMCLTSSTLYEISESEFRAFCAKNPDFLFEVARILAKELRSSELRLSGHHDKSANRRIIESLIFLKLKHPNYIWTRKEIAEFAGSTFESVVRVMSSLQEEGHISKKGRDFDINDLDRLMEHASAL